MVAFQNRGDPELTAHNSGNGIVLGSVQNGYVTLSTAYDNGGAEGSREGPVGIWAYDSTRVKIEASLSYDNTTDNQTDGDGFGLDENTSDSCLEYDLSYGNAGSGYLVLGRLNNGMQTGDVVRFNISSGDVRDQNGAYGGISVIGYSRDAAVYQNTVVMGRHVTGTVPALLVGSKIDEVTVRNNIFLTHAGAVITAQKFSLRPARVLLQGNDYYATAGPWAVVWGSDVYNSVGSWASATGQEVLVGRLVGRTVDPDLQGPVLRLRATLPGDSKVSQDFRLRRGSPLIGAGLDLSRLFALNPGPRDYAGTLVSETNPNIGAE